MHIEPERTRSRRSPRVVFLGMRGDFSLLPLAALLDAHVDVRAVLIPSPADLPGASRSIPPFRPGRLDAVRGSTLPVRTPFVEPSIVSLAWTHAIPVLEVADERATGLLDAVRHLDPDIACVACWPGRLSASFLSIPRLGCLNLHPSLLPRHRGPAPLFWTLRVGDACAGVTVHAMNAALDGGDILAQADVGIPDGLTGAEIERQCAATGGALLVDIIEQLFAGTAHRRRQAQTSGTYEPWPSTADFVVTPERSARWAFRFIRGSDRWGGPAVIAVDDQRFTVRAALSFEPDATLGVSYRRDQAHLWLQCSPGVLHVLVDDTSLEDA
jgi:methionyl-tRNA formyltransferase